MKQSNKVLALLKSGRMFTSAQLAGMVGGTPSGVRSRIAELRVEGHSITTGQTKAGKPGYVIRRAR